jgi:HEAT repeat protein
VPLLKDAEVNLIVPWSLGEIGDKSAIPPLVEMLGDSRLEMRAAVLRALEKLEGKECRPPLRQIEDGCTIAVNPKVPRPEPTSEFSSSTRRGG